jgi:Tfp pilus assembly protein PilF
MSCAKAGWILIIAGWAALFAPGHALASTALVWGTTHPEQEVWTVQTYADTTEATITPIRPSASVTVLILPETVHSANWESFKQQLLEFYSGLHSHPLQVAFLHQNRELTGPLPVLSRSRFKQLLENVEKGPDDSGTWASASVLDDLLAIVPRLGPDRSAVLLAAELPKLDSATTALASALLLRAFAAQRLRVSLFSPAANAAEWSAVFRALGGAVISALQGYSFAHPNSAEALLQLDWVAPLPSAGFVASLSTLASQAGSSVLEMPDLAVANGALLPSVQQYADTQNRIAEAESLLGEAPLTQERAERIRSDLQAALQLNPRDPEALRLAAFLYERTGDIATAVAVSAYLVEVKPRASPAYAALGHELRLHGEFDRAETALRRAADLGLATAELNDDFARLCVARKDDKGALPYLQAALRLAPSLQDLWFFQGQVAERTENTALAEDSYERGLALGGVHIAEAGALLRLYLNAKQTDRATEFAKRQIAGVPAEAGPRLRLATVLDDLHQSDLALQAWRRLLEIQPGSEAGNTRVARLLLEAGQAAEAEKAAITGLNAVPNSSPLYLVKADAEESLGLHYQARRTLQEGAATIRDAALWARLVATEERYFGGAASAYARLAELSPPSSPGWQRALQRGFAVSLRDDNLPEAQRFASLLDTPAREEYRPLLGKRKSGDNYALVPGGLNALAFAAHVVKEEIPADRFFLVYCHTLILNSAETDNNDYANSLRDYFESIAALQALGKRGPAGVTITLSLTDKESRRQTEKALSILGIRLRNSNGDVELAQGEKKSQAGKQETASALAVDEVGIQQALQAGTSYRLEIPDEQAWIYPSERVWREAFYAKSGDAGGFAEALIRSPRLARLYVSLNSMDRDAAGELTKTLSLRDLQHDADLLYYYGASFALEGSHAAVPGGPKAEGIWMNLAGASPASPGAFFRALLTRDDGKLLVFFSLLAELDQPHQMFFTSNESRTRRFYGLLSSSGHIGARPYVGAETLALRRLLRSVPLDTEGHVGFPGSAAVWTVVKGRSSDESGTAQLITKLRKAAPGLEDAVLVRLAETRYGENHTRLTELDNFVAVARIDAHRSEPMDEESALLLAQRYGDYSAVYPYFTDLRNLTVHDYQQFFLALDHVVPRAPLEANLELGELHALTEWICLLIQRRVIGDEEAAKLFRRMAAGFAAAVDSPAYVEASIDTLRGIIGACQGRTITDADTVLEFCLLGRHAASQDARAKDFARVLQAQQVPSLTTLLALYDAVLALPKGKAIDFLPAIEKAIDGLPAVDFPKGASISGKDKNALRLYNPAGARKVAAQLRERAAERKPNFKELEKLTRELLGELQPQVAIALAGPLYAYFLRAADLVVINDPWLLRKHHYLDFSDQLDTQKVPDSAFIESSEAAGSYFLGGFAGFAYSAGMAAVHSLRVGAGGIESMAAQLAALRTADWDSLDESDQRLAALRIIVAREWICEAARNPELLAALREETLGLLALARRADLLNGILARDWSQVWESITLSDLFSLGGRYAQRFSTDPWLSEATAALRAAEQRHHGRDLNSLGPLPAHLFGCNHLHLRATAPYEEFERAPEEIGERTAEFKLYLAFQADRLGLQPRALNAVAENLALQAFRNAQMMDYRDWRSLLKAYAAVDAKDLEQAVKP